MNSRLRGATQSGPGLPGSDSWKKTQFALTVSVFTWYAGTGFVFPFLALYVQELGGFGIKEAALWSGFIIGSAPLASAVSGPLWGEAADRVGRKTMLQRSILGFSAALLLAALVNAPWQLLVARILMGLMGGFHIAALAIVSLSNPSDRVDQGIGALQSARVLGSAAGPLVGGTLADMVGIRNSFFLSVALGIVAFVVVTMFVNEPSVGRRQKSMEKVGNFSLRSMLASPAFFTALVVLMVLRLSERTFEPIVPLMLSNMEPSGFGLATTAGIIIGTGFGVTSIIAWQIGRLTRGRSVRKLLWLSVLVGMLVFLSLSLVDNWWQLLLLRAAAGAVFGAAVPLGLSIGAQAVAPERRGLGIGLLGSGAAYGAAMGSIVAGLIGNVNLNLAFLFDALALGAALVILVLSFRRLRPNSRRVN